MWLWAGLSPTAPWLVNLILSVCLPEGSSNMFSYTVHFHCKLVNHLGKKYTFAVSCKQHISLLEPPAAGYILYLLAGELCMNPMWLCLLFLHCIYLCKQACVYVCVYVCMPFQFTRPAPPPPIHHHHLSRCCQVTVFCYGLVFVGQLYDGDVTLQCKTFTALAFVKK